MRRTRAAATACALAALVLASCSDDADPEEPGPGPAAESSAPAGPAPGVVVTTTEDEELVFDDFDVTCRDSEDDQPEARIVVATATATATGDDAATLQLTTVETTNGWRLDLPHVEEYGSEETFVNLFVAVDGTELSSAEEGASGSLLVALGRCDPTPGIEVQVEGTLGSENSDDTATVEGRISVG
ncbi:hypothetical protein [Nocardioides sp. J54]|uniref:hypothetical protein n=1 Tax=Nocardioides sp. J54 TaxID=935866 RepID=UPI00048BBBE2|nr:hypothetical protein [Nocardioides sp. J54]